MRRAGLPLALAGLAACAGHQPPPAPRPAADTVAARPAPPPSPIPMPPPAPVHLPAPVRLAFVGDINLGTTTFPDGVPPDTGRGLLDGARSALTGDLVVGNFEGVLADTGTSEKCERLRPRRERRHGVQSRRRQAPDTAQVRPGCYAFRTPTTLAPRLTEAGFTHLNLANNHANDFGLDGRRSTDSILASLGLDTYGPLGRVAIDTVRRGDASTIVGIVGFTTYPFAYDLLDIPRSVAVVDSIRPLVDLLVVTFHGGAEGSDALHLPFAAESLGHEQRGELRAWAHAVVDAGADLVVGHGPHVLRGIEMWQGRLIAYSLGNFVTYRGFNLAGPQGLTGVLDVEFAANGHLARARLHPMRQGPLQGPAPDPEQSAARLVRALSTDDFGGSAARIDNDGTIGPP